MQPSVKIVIVNGNPSPETTSLETGLRDLSENLKEKGHTVKIITLKDKKIKSCSGCFDCWWKHPGLCRHDDDVKPVMKDIILSDFVIFAAPMIMGMYSALLKRLQDRLIPLIHPYIEIREGESHHEKRYDKYPKLGILLDKRDSTEEEFENVRYIYDRIAINFHSKVLFFQDLDNLDPKLINNAISHI